MGFLDLLYWLGAICLMIAPITTNTTTPIMAVIGLSLLTIQAIENQLINLIILNVSSIIAWGYNYKRITNENKNRIN